MFEPFSRAYYLGRMYVRPHGGDRAVIHEQHHERVNERLYGDADDDPDADAGAGERPDRPLVVKLGTAHLPVHGAPGVPEGTLAVPEAGLAAAGVDNPPTLSPVLLAKEWVAERLFGRRGAPRYGATPDEG